MTASSKATIKSYFEVGDKPTQSNFVDFIDSYQDANSNLLILASASPGTFGLQMLNTVTTAAAVAALGGVGDMFKATYDAANIAQQVVGTTAIQAITNKSFDGTNTATTQAALDSSTKLATTAFVTTANQVLQQVRTQTGAVASGTTVMPYDDTIPQITEGDQYMSLAITPKSATSKLVIEFQGMGSSSVFTATCIALFQDATANALAATVLDESQSGQSYTWGLKHTMTSGTTSATTFRIRIGPNSAGTITFNGVAAARKFGGVASSTLIITEYAA